MYVYMENRTSRQAFYLVECTPNSLNPESSVLSIMYGSIGARGTLKVETIPTPPTHVAMRGAVGAKVTAKIARGYTRVESDSDVWAVMPRANGFLSRGGAAVRPAQADRDAWAAGRLSTAEVWARAAEAPTAATPTRRERDQRAMGREYMAPVGQPEAAWPRPPVVTRANAGAVLAAIAAAREAQEAPVDPPKPKHCLDGRFD